MHPQFIAANAAPSRARQLVRANDVLVSTVRPNLNGVALVPFQFDGEIASTGFCVLRPQPKQVCAEYLFYFTQSAAFIGRLTRIANGASYPAVTDDDILESSIPLPSLTEQRQIADRLKQADRLRRSRRYALELNSNFLPAVFLELFGDPLALMLRWDRRPFGELLAIELRNGLSPSTAGKMTARVLTLSAITRGSFDASSSKLAAFAGEPPDEKRVSSKDFLICRGNGNLGLVGRARFPLHDARDCVFPDTMIAARVKPEMIRRQFLEAVWDSPALRKQIEASARTTNGTHKINQTVIEELEIPLPPIPLQDKFAALVDRVERLRKVQKEALRQAEHLFSSLLDRAFRGH